MSSEKQTGSCLCGAVQFEVNGPMRNVVYCHCTQCRKSTGHYFAATACDNDKITFHNDQGLKWYRSSGTAERGFCQICGSGLFWKPDHGEHLSILAGVLDSPTHLKDEAHIFVADKGDYYQIDGPLPKYPQSD